MADKEDRPNVTDKPKKRQIKGRKRSLLRDEKRKSHATGPPCNCTKLKCFEVTNEDDRRRAIDHFNALKTKDEQDALLASFISVHAIQRRRSRKDDAGDAEFHKNTFKYHFTILRDDRSSRVDVCIKGFLSMFGVTENRVRRIRDTLATTGLPPKDMRGHHTSRPHALTDDDRGLIVDHIRSFRGRTSHYSRKKSKRLYLPEQLNISKMFRMFKETFPVSKCSYDTYRDIFNNQFNISFGYPRKDTCSTCDLIKCQIEGLNAELLQTTSESESAARFLQQKERLDTELNLHQRKAEVFYERKKAAKVEAQRSGDVEAICFDFQKNLPCPNVTTQDVYFARQLSFYSFNIHFLSTDKAFFYCYDETVGRKGADDVSSMLDDCLRHHVSEEVKHLPLFCDSCAGQNKNWTVLRFLFHQVHFVKRFDSITITFPIRGHSYMECDRDMANVNQSFPAEVPEDWRGQLSIARTKPDPFNVINMTGDMFFKFTTFLTPLFLVSCPFSLRPIRELKIIQEKPHLMFFRACWNGPFSSAPVTKRRATKQAVRRGNVSTDLSQLRPQQAYAGPLALKAGKLQDLSKLKKYVSVKNMPFFENLPRSATPADISESDSESSISGSDSEVEDQ